MSAGLPSVFRDALQVSPERVAAMSDVELNVLMTELLEAQAYTCRSRVDKVRANTEVKAADDGCDGWTAKPEIDDGWLGDGATCWQFKAGVAGQPSKLEEEVGKRIPRETLAAGGWLVVVASGSTNGVKGEDDRRTVLVDAATREGLPTDRIKVIGSEGLTTWCNKHPAVAARWAGRPDGLWLLDSWQELDVHQVRWHASDDVNAALAQLRVDLDFDRGKIEHLHIQGQPGVGKTRFALELCVNP